MPRYYYSNDNFFLKDEREGMFRSPACYADYQNGMNFFHSRLSRLHATLYLLDRLNDYPRDLLGKHTLFRLLSFDLSEYIIVSLYSLTTDKQSFTFKDFIRRLLTELVAEEHRAVLERRLAEVDSQEDTKDIEARVKRLRNEAFAHTNRRWIGFAADKSPIDDSVEFSELKDLTGELDDLYEAVNVRVPARDVPR